MTSYIIVQKFGVGKIFFNFFKKKPLVLTKAAFIWAKIQLKSNIVRYYYNLKFLFSSLSNFKVFYILFLW